jgi:4-diphosphocytidyl-2-C-methyl-D-erythritol kinase
LLRGSDTAGMTLPGVALTAAAKVNLALHVIGRREDGYHLLDSIAVFADVGDRVEVTPGERLTVDVAGPFASHAPGDRTDLAWRAAESFFAQVGASPAVAIRIEKNIPAGAGLGGGSADAAAVLIALSRLHDGRLPLPALSAIGLSLGADVPMCVAGRALRARGIGEQVEQLESWPPLSLVLVWPGRPISTAEIFRALARRENPPLPEPPGAPTLSEAAAWLASCRNDLEGPVLAMAPEIGEVLRRLRETPGCLLARMSGSGSACFGLYADLPQAESAARHLGQANSGWWARACTAR